MCHSYGWNIFLLHYRIYSRYITEYIPATLQCPQLRDCCQDVHRNVCPLHTGTCLQSSLNLLIPITLIDTSIDLCITGLLESEQRVAQYYRQKLCHVRYFNTMITPKKKLGRHCTHNGHPVCVRIHTHTHTHTQSDQKVSVHLMIVL